MTDTIKLAREYGAWVDEGGEVVFENEPQLTAFVSRIRAEAMEEAAKLVPTNWLHPLLTGPEAVGNPPFDCPAIERLLRGVSAAIRSAASTTSTPDR